MMAKAFTRPYYFEKEKNDWEITKTNTVKITRMHGKSEKGIWLCKHVRWSHTCILYERDKPLPPLPPPQEILKVVPYDFQTTLLKNSKGLSLFPSPNKNRKIFIQISTTTKERKKISTTTLISPVFLPSLSKKKFARRKRTFNFWLSSWAEPGLIEHIPHD